MKKPYYSHQVSIIAIHAATTAMLMSCTVPEHPPNTGACEPAKEIQQHEETPPWGSDTASGTSWKGRIQPHENPTKMTPKGIFLALGFYEAARDDMTRHLSVPRARNSAGWWLEQHDRFEYGGDGASPRVKLIRNLQSDEMALTVYVDNGAGWDKEIVWKYRVRLSPSRVNWIIEEIKPIKGYAW